MARLFKEERRQAIDMLATGGSNKMVAKQIWGTIARIYRLKTRFLPTGTSLDRPNRSRPSVTNARQHRKLRLQRLREQFFAQWH